MKVLHLLSGEFNSGASRGAIWLHEALKNNGCDSEVLIDSLYSTCANDIIHNDSKIKKINKIIRVNLNRIPSYVYRNKNKTLFSPNILGRNITNMQCYKEADIINLHWINDGFLSLSELRKIKKPIVWTLRDMWPLTGGCHYALDCEKYKSNCNNCPQLGSKSSYDLSTFIQRKKRKIISDNNITAIGISKWISECARNSTVFENSKVRYIGNVIDTDLFKPIDKVLAKKVLGLENKKVISIGAQNINDFYKGMNEFISAIELIKEKKDIHILTFGKVSPEIFERLGVSFTCYGFVHDSLTLNLIYSASDVFVAPSKIEAFGKTIGEAMACNTPVVAFNYSGPVDIIDHLENGYLAEPFSSEDLSKGIEFILSSSSSETISKSPRDKILKKFSPNVIAKEYIEIYKTLI